ncbi:MAG TPA: DUF4124 domain-containing protein [Nevskia sp.]|nr:DUF4124 domain-containing protein [Nevskia sp.]
MRARRTAWRLLIPGILCACITAHAGAYRWTDENGVTHYADAPPPKGQNSGARAIAPPPAVKRPPAMHKWRIETDDGSREFETPSDRIIVNSDGGDIEIITEPDKIDRKIEKMLRRKGAK